MSKKNSKPLLVLSLIFLLLIFAGVAPPVQAAIDAAPLPTDKLLDSGQAAFTDIPGDSPLAPYVRYVTEKGIIEGNQDGSFRPSESVTRAKAAAVAVRLKGIRIVKDGPLVYTDVKLDHWAYGEITAATKYGLFRGYPDGTFNPDSIITRAEAVTLLLRLSGGSLSDKVMAIGDVGPGHWAYRRVVTALEAGLIELPNDKLFKPDLPFLRGDLARSLSAVVTLGPALRNTGLNSKLTVIKGKATLTTARSVYHDAVTEAQVGAGATVTTKEDGQAEITFDDGSGILLESDTEVVITKTNGVNYMRSDGLPGVTVDTLSLTLNRGVIVGALAGRAGNGEQPDKTASPGNKEGKPVVIASGNNNGNVDVVEVTAWWNEPYAQRERVFVEMPWGTVSIGGGFWINRVTTTEQGTALIKGAATFTAGGTAVTLAGGQSTTITAKGTPASTPVALSQADSLTLESARAWIDERSSSIQDKLPALPASIARSF